MKQLKLLKSEPSAYGGSLLTTRKGRSRGRPLATKSSMHLVLRASKAKGAWSFRLPKNKRVIAAILEKFGKKYGVRVLSLANVGNHLHIHIQLTNRGTYKAFIRAVTAAIAMAVTGINRWTAKQKDKAKDKLRFWDRRPFTRIIVGFRAFLNLRDYVLVNQLEGLGIPRDQARGQLRRWSSA